MGLIKRLHRLTVSRIETFLSTVEDPETLFPQLLREMEDQVRAATEAEAKAMASAKASERDIEQTKGKLERLGKGAQLAINKGDEATAREAVAAQVAQESELKHKEESLARSRTALEDARNARKQIQAQLDEMRSKKDQILTRARTAKTRKKIEQTVNGPVSSATSILDTVAQLESKVEETEAELDIQREISGDRGGPSLDNRLKDLEQDSEVEERLAALKTKTGAKKV